MKILGYVNRFNRGILNVQEELGENGNGLAVFDFDKITVFGVTVKNAVNLLFKALKNGTSLETAQETAQENNNI